MSSNLEKRLKRIEDDLKYIKGAYTTSGTNVQLYVTKQSFTVTITDPTVIQIQFTPQYGLGNVIMANLSGKAVHSSGVMYYTFWGAHQIIQDGSGNAIIEFPFLNSLGGGVTEVFDINVVASATSPGTFTRIS